MEENKTKGYEQISEYIAPYWITTKDGFIENQLGLSIEYSEDKKEWVLSRFLGTSMDLTYIKIPLTTAEINRVKDIISRFR
jgi:hypothetical protein